MIPRPHYISGKLAGDYTIQLASDSSTGQKLEAVLSINEEDSYGVYFVVHRKGVRSARRFSLKSAINLYESREPK